ncbi:DUF5610 domain-containing protein [Duganella dendranthematis]|jgi:hypothetical protein|uniref:DUF5610 domain-containing protein n=1 Tax=Duganella dendranthematis TaxID=2728021 RepID=A0ABX6MC33_9BURK|nr:DUF5610 domain-containing protein [Duganella dendranthematis]QJD91897.1 DUF5610 domain-containing protein [Duganella dendranthematis]
MATPVSLTSSNTTNAATQVQAKDDKPVSVAAKAKADLNASIVQASLSVSISSSNDQMSVVLKTALTGINEALKKDGFGDDAIQNAASQDNTPEGTAGRIVSLSTGFFEAYKQQHPGEDEGELLNKFMDTIKSGMERGFKEAREVLQGLNALNGDISSNIDKTYELVQKGYDDFIAAHQAKTDTAATGASTSNTAASATATDKAAA